MLFRRHAIAAVFLASFAKDILRTSCAALLDVEETASPDDQIAEGHSLTSEPLEGAAKSDGEESTAALEAQDWIAAGIEKPSLAPSAAQPIPDSKVVEDPVDTEATCPSDLGGKPQAALAEPEHPGIGTLKPQTKATWSAMCFLGDAGVQDVADLDCSTVSLPADYQQFCGRWQCSDPRVDLCFYTDISSRQKSAPTESSTTSHEQPRQIQKEEHLRHIKTELEMIEAAVNESKATNASKTVNDSMATNESDVNDSLESNMSDQAANQLAGGPTPHRADDDTAPSSSAKNDMSADVDELQQPLVDDCMRCPPNVTAMSARWRRHQRPVCLRPCPVPAPNALLASSDPKGMCMELDKGSWTEEEALPVCLEESLIRDKWMELFMDRALAQREARQQEPAPTTNNKTVVRRRHDQCLPSEPFRQCDAHGAADVDRIWRRFGADLIAKLTGTADADEVSAGSSGAAARDNATGSRVQTWRHCANEGELCLCSGDVRFGYTGQWSSEILTVRHGVVSCSPELFGAALPLESDAPASAAASNGTSGVPGTQAPADDAPRGVCECSSVRRRGPLATPSSETAVAAPPTLSPSGSGQTEDELDGLQPRFIHGTPYPVDFKNGVKYDYASRGAGARMVTHAKGLKHAAKVLVSDSEYLRTSCDTRVYFVVSLLEDLFLEHIGLVTLEFFASGFRHLQILGSSKYPTDQWQLLGEIETSPVATHELFDIGSRCRHKADACWVRFLKVRVLSHHNLEDNTYCALTQFQAFGSTQTRYIAEVHQAKEAADRHIEPSIAQVSDWHDDAVRQAFTGFGPQLLGKGPHSTGTPEESGQEEPQPSNSDTADGQGLVMTQTLLRVQDLLSQRTKATPLASIPQRFLRWLFNGAHLPRDAVDGPEVHPATAEGATPAASADGTPSETSDSKSPETGNADRARMSLSEVLVDLNASAAIADLDFKAIEKLSSALGSLVNAPDVVAAASASLNSISAKSPPAAPPAARPAKTSSSTPALVRMDTELRNVQDSQAVLQNRISSTESVLTQMFAIFVHGIRDQSARLNEIEDMSQSRTSDSNDNGFYDEIVFIIQHFLPYPWRGLLVRIISQISIDRCLLLLLFLWVRCKKKEPVVSQPAKDESLFLSPVCSPVLSASDDPHFHDPHAFVDAEASRRSSAVSVGSTRLNEYTVSGVDGKRLRHELRRTMHHQKKGPPPLNLPPPKEIEKDKDVVASPKKKWKPEDDDNMSSSSFTSDPGGSPAKLDALFHHAPFHEDDPRSAERGKHRRQRRRMRDDDMQAENATHEGGSVPLSRHGSFTSRHGSFASTQDPAQLATPTGHAGVVGFVEVDSGGASGGGTTSGGGAAKPTSRASSTQKTSSGTSGYRGPKRHSSAARRHTVTSRARSPRG